MALIITSVPGGQVSGARDLYRHEQVSISGLEANVVTVIKSGITDVRKFLSGMVGGVNAATTLQIRSGTSIGSATPLFSMTLGAGSNFCFKANPDANDYMCCTRPGEALYVVSSVELASVIAFHFFEQ